MISISKKQLIIVGVSLIVIVVSIVGAIVSRPSNQSSPKAQSPTIKPTVNYNPPTQQEKQAANDQKQADIDKQKAIENAQNTPQTANVVVTEAKYYKLDGDTVQVRAYVSNVYETGGSCTAVFTRSGKTVTGSSTPFKDVSTTQCGALDVPRSQFSEAGDWQLIVKYQSPTTSGQSASQTVSITP